MTGASPILRRAWTPFRDVPEGPGDYARPPCIEIVNHELHHEVLDRMKRRQDEAAGADSEDGNIAIQNLLEAEPRVEALGYLDISGGNEGSR